MVKKRLTSKQDVRNVIILKLRKHYYSRALIIMIGYDIVNKYEISCNINNFQIEFGEKR